MNTIFNLVKCLKGSLIARQHSKTRYLIGKRQKGRLEEAKLQMYIR